MKPISENLTPSDCKANQNFINLLERFKSANYSSALESTENLLKKTLHLVDAYEDMIKSLQNESENASLNKNFQNEKLGGYQNQLAHIVTFIGRSTSELIVSNNEKSLNDELNQLCLKYSNLILNLAEKSVIFFLFCQFAF